MADEGFKRKLAAILSADVIGYSRLMRDDEEATVRDIASHRILITGIIQQHNGRVVDSPGDNILAEFASVVDAVNGAIKIQREIKESNTGIHQDRRMEFRIGINLGDVIEEDARIYGDGVNIAARVEGLAAGGGIAISGTVYEHIKDKLSLGYHYLGEQEVKNIPEPVRVYRLLTDPDDAGKMIGEKQPKSKKLRWATFTTIALIILAVGIFAIWNFISQPEVEPASIEKMALPLPERPSIAVLPFDNLSGDPKTEYIADGFTENIITGLSQIPELFVIARNSVFTYKGKPIKVNQVSEELGVKYVLEGSIQKSGDRLRVNAQLIDALKGNHLWAERYDRELKDLFQIQDEITIKIANAMQVKLVLGEREWTYSDNLDAWRHLVKGTRLFDRFTKEDNRKAIEHFEQAIKFEPGNTLAWAWLAWAHLSDGYWGWSDTPEKSIRKSFEIYQNNSKDWSKSDRHLFLSQIYVFQGQLEKAIVEGEKAVDLNPNSSRCHYLLASSLSFGGRPKEAIVHLKKAMRLEPYYPPFFLRTLGICYDQSGQYEEALTVQKSLLDRALNGEFSLELAHRRSVLAYARLGMMKEARAHAEKLLKIDPDFSVDEWRKHPVLSVFKDQQWVDSYGEMLLKGGLPEHPPLKLPDKPSIAVLPFDNMSGDQTQEYIADGITESIITALSKIPNLLVIARNSTFTYKNKPVKVQHVSRELGVRYVLEGSVQKSGDRIRINAQLIDATKGHHLWAEKYDRKFKDIFALQDDITLNVLKELEVELTSLGGGYALGTDNPEAYLKVIKGVYYLWRFNQEDNAIARKLFEEAIALDPSYAVAYSVLGDTYWAEVFGFWSMNVKESIAKVEEMAQKTIALDDSYSGGHYLMSIVYKMRGQIDKAVAEGKIAIALNPNGADNLAAQVDTLKIADRPEEALKLMEKAMRLNPMPPSWYYVVLGSVYHMLGRYEDAITAYEPIFNQEADYMSFMGRIGLTFAYLELGRQAEARIQAEEALKIRPGSFVAWATAFLRYKDMEHLKRLTKPLESLQYGGIGKRKVYANEGTPFFKFEYPAESVKAPPNPNFPEPVVFLKTPSAQYIVASVVPIPENLDLADTGSKYYVELLNNTGTATNIKIVSNEPVILKDGTKAYRAELEYEYITGAYRLGSVVVSAFRGNKLVTLEIHTTAGEQSELAWVPESLTFRQ